MDSSQCGCTIVLSTCRIVEKDCNLSDKWLNIDSLLTTKDRQKIKICCFFYWSAKVCINNLTLATYQLTQHSITASTITSATVSWQLLYKLEQTISCYHNSSKFCHSNFGNNYLSGFYQISHNYSFVRLSWHALPISSFSSNFDNVGSEKMSEWPG